MPEIVTRVLRYFWASGAKTYISQCSALHTTSNGGHQKWMRDRVGAHPLDLGSWDWFPKLGIWMTQSQFKLPFLQSSVESPANTQYQGSALDEDTSE